MGGVIEILLADLGHDGMDGVVVQQDRRENGLLRLDIVRRDPPVDFLVSVRSLAHVTPSGW